MNVRNGIDNPSQILPPAGLSGTAASSPLPRSQEKGLGNDQASVSVTAGQVAESASASDVRMDKVASVQNALQAGTYNVPASAVAEKIIGAMTVPS
jgi:negative regulator of flagellin synthesis FlgM